MHGTNPDTRKAYITALRELADYLSANPDLPVPQYGSTASVHADSADHGGRDQVDRIAAQLGTPVEDTLTSAGYYQVKRDFGPIEYVAYAVSDATKARNQASASYWGCVTPDSSSDRLATQSISDDYHATTPNPAAEWLLADFDATAADHFEVYDEDADELIRPAGIQPMFMFKTDMEPGAEMRVTQNDYADRDRWWLW
jgi:hypothetical protein